MDLSDVLAKNRLLRGCHAGQRCFVVGNGPSLKRQDLSLLEGEVFIVVSHFERHPRLKALMPPYWVIADPLFWERPKEHLHPVLEPLIQMGIHTRMCFPVPAMGALAAAPTGPLIDLHFYLFGPQHPGDEEIDLCRPIPQWGQNVISPAIMLAFHLGCDPIHLIGCDHDFLTIGREQYEGKTFEHYYKEESRPPSTRYDWETWSAAMERTLWEYEQLHAYAQRWGRRIYNATDGGHLEVFPRVRFDELFPVSSDAAVDVAALARSAVRQLNAGDHDGADVLLMQAQASNVGGALHVAGLEALRAVCAARNGDHAVALAYARQAQRDGRDPGGLATELVAAVDGACSPTPIPSSSSRPKGQRMATAFSEPCAHHIPNTDREERPMSPPLRDRAGVRDAYCPPLPTVPECIAHHRDRAPDALALSLHTGGAWQPLTRAQFWTVVERWAATFTAELDAPTMVLFSKRLDVDLLAAYIGAMLAGHVPAQISYPSAKMGPAEFASKVAHVRSITEVGAVFIDDDNADLLVSWASACRADCFEGLKTFTPTIRSPGARVRFAPQSDALVQFSSGSTGLQKGVFLQHGGLVAHMQAYAEHLDLRGNDAIISWLPLYHDMGLIAAYLMPLMCGVPFHQLDPFAWLMQPGLLLSSIEPLAATICYQPNFAYHVLAGRAPTAAPNLGGVRLWINCSEPARAESHALFTRTFPSVDPSAMSVCYALAENSFAVSQTMPAQGNVGRQQGAVLSCGRPLAGVDVKIFPTAERGDGEIGIRAPFLFDRFTDGSLPVCEDGYYLTGDLGFVDAHGEIYVAGRKKDLVIVNGKNVYPQDVEFVASKVDGVYPGRVVAFGEPNPMTGSEELYLIVERRGQADPTQLKLAVQRAVEAEIGLLPRRVEVVEHMKLIKTSSGKISRSRNKELYAAGAMEIV